MPSPNNYIFPFIIQEFTILAGQHVSVLPVDCGNFSPVALVTPGAWTTSNVTFESGRDLGLAGIVYTPIAALDSTGMVVIYTLGGMTSSTKISLDPVVFSGSTIIKPSSTTAQAFTVTGYIISAPLYTITS